MLERSRHLSGALFDCRGYCIIPFEEVSYFQEENAAWRNAQSITKHLQSHQKNALPGGLYHPVAEQARQQDNKKTASHKQRERERERGDGSAGLCHQNAHRRATSIPVQPGAKIGVEALGNE